MGVPLAELILDMGRGKVPHSGGSVPLRLGWGSIPLRLDWGSVPLLLLRSGIPLGLGSRC